MKLPQPSEQDKAQAQRDFREELVFAAAFIRSRCAADGNIVAVMRALASVIGQTSVQLAPEVDPGRMLGMLCWEMQRSAQIYLNMSAEERITAARSLHNA